MNALVLLGDVKNKYLLGGAQETAPPGTGQGLDIKSGHGLSKWVLGVCSLILLHHPSDPAGLPHPQ